MLIALVYLLYHKQFTLRIPLAKIVSMSAAIIKIGIAPFGLAMTPNISLIIINRFSMSYGGEPAIATYACIAYIICIIYLILCPPSHKTEKLSFLSLVSFFIPFH